MKKSVDISTIIVGIFLLVVTVTVLVAIILAKSFSRDLIWPTIALGVFWLVILAWYLVIRPLLNKKLVKYSVELERVKKEDLEKQRKIYAKMNK